MCSLYGLSKSAAALAAAMLVSSCYTCGPEPFEDAYVVINETSSPYISFAAYGFTQGYEQYVAKDDSYHYMTEVGDGCVKGDPAKVWAAITTRDSVIEIVPKLMATDSSYSIFSGLEDWYTVREGYIFELRITDEVMAYIANRMRTQGLQPYKIVRDEIVNQAPGDVVISTLSADSVLNSFSVAACDTVVLPEAGLLFDGDHYKVEACGGEHVEDGSAVLMLDSESSRIDAATGVRRFYLTDFAWRCWNFPTGGAQTKQKGGN